MRILYYTDSRGKRIGSYQNHQHYGDRLIEYYKTSRIERYMCPEKWTTTIDFIRLLWTTVNIDNYDWIILHTSVVENSPRVKDDAYNKIYLDPNKKTWFDMVFGEENMINHFKNDFGPENIYEDKKTLNMFSLEMGVEYLVPLLEKIPNLIWISNCPLVGGNGSSWRGTYWKDRPNNMEIVNEISKAYIKEMNNTHVIDTTNWSDEEIKKYTVDNIHYTKEGSDLIFEMIKDIINKKSSL